MSPKRSPIQQTGIRHLVRMHSRYHQGGTSPVSIIYLHLKADSWRFMGILQALGSQMASLHFSRTLADSISKLVNINGIEEKVLQQFHGRKMICRKLSKVSKSSLLEDGESHNPCEIPSTFRINAAKIGKKKEHTQILEILRGRAKMTKISRLA